jgi:penicillin-binding protein 1A
MDDQADSGGGRMTIRRGGERWRRLLTSRWAKALGVLIGLILIVWLAIWLIFARDLPSTDKLLAYEPPLPTNLRGLDGQPIYTFARERRIELAYNEFPPLLVDAFVSAEDKTFFSHHGIDISGLASAMVDYVRKAGTGERARGGSTITQQVAKNLLTGNE